MRQRRFFWHNLESSVGFLWLRSYAFLTSRGTGKRGYVTDESIAPVGNIGVCDSEDRCILPDGLLWRCIKLW